MCRLPHVRHIARGNFLFLPFVFSSLNPNVWKFIIRELKQFAIAIDKKNIIMFPVLKIKVNVIWSYIML